MDSEANAFRVEFPDFSCSILQKLNQQRQRGQLCDLVVAIGGHRYRAHRAVLAASSPYFCDQVLLKNSARVVLPDVMHPCVFERLLQSCYTGALILPAGDVVAFLTAASFLQMWHVVDKCTELLEAGTPLGGTRGGRKAAAAGQRRSPPLGGEGDGGAAAEGFGEMAAGCRDSADMDELLGGGFSPRALELGAPPAERPGSEEDGDAGDAPDYPHSRPAYVPPSIMGHRRWVQVKAERPGLEDGGLFSAEPDAGAGCEQTSGLPQQSRGIPPGDGADEKPAARLEQSLGGDRPYEDPLDFYGTSGTEGFSRDEAGGGSPPPPPPRDELAPGGAAGAGGDAGLQEETPHSGFASLVYKLYPCQCGKSFTHKSQRDRHMSMHLGLRPYGCAVCGKSFKMKHHLVGHMKIHTGVKPYECSLCSKRFMWRDSFNRHTSSCTRAHQARRAVAEQIC